MSDYLDPADPFELDAEDHLVARLLGGSVERRADGIRPAGDSDVVACATEFGDRATENIRSVIALYEASRQ